MEHYIARAPLINYIGAAAWIALPVSVAIAVFVLIAKKFRYGMVVDGALLIIGVVPALTFATIGGLIVALVCLVGGVTLLVAGILRVKR